jgi:hypothetical protein
MRLPLKAQSAFDISTAGKHFSGAACVSFLDNAHGECAMAQVSALINTDDTAVLHFASPTIADATESRPKTVVITGSYSYALGNSPVPQVTAPAF